MVRPGPVPPRSNVPFQALRARVTRVEPVSPNFTRITFAGPELAHMARCRLDQRVKLLLPRPGQTRPALPEHDRSYPALQRMPADLQPVRRSYTIRAHRPELRECDIDFVLHAESGPGSAFAARAVPGDEVAIFGPDAGRACGRAGVEYRLGAVTDQTLLVGDETALPAIGGILEDLPAGVRARVCVQVPDLADAQRFATRADVDVAWLERGAPSRHAANAMVDMVRELELPRWGLYSWIAGESAMVKAVRRHLLSERGLDRAAITFMGYWRSGKAEGEPAHESPART